MDTRNRMLNELIEQIKKSKEKLIKKAKRKGLYENFGQKEVARLSDMVNRVFDPYTMEGRLALNEVMEFNYWCMNLTDKDLEGEV